MLHRDSSNTYNPINCRMRNTLPASANILGSSWSRKQDGHQSAVIRMWKHVMKIIKMQLRGLVYLHTQLWYYTPTLHQPPLQTFVCGKPSPYISIRESRYINHLHWDKMLMFPLTLSFAPNPIPKAKPFKLLPCEDWYDHNVWYMYIYIVMFKCCNDDCHPMVMEWWTGYGYKIRRNC